MFSSLSSLYRSSISVSSASVFSRRGASRSQGSLRRRVPPSQAGAAIDEFLQFVGIAGTRHRHFLGDLFRQKERRQGLVKGLHSEFVLPRLHSGVNLVNLVFAN